MDKTKKGPVPVPERDLPKVKNWDEKSEPPKKFVQGTVEPTQKK